MPPRHTIAIEIDARRVRGVWASRDGAAVSLGGSFVDTIPPEVNPQDAVETGRWLRTQLRAFGFPRAGVTLVIPRERVVLKRLSMPTTDRDELTDMVRLAMLREVPFDAETAIVDFVPVGATATSTSVMAVAVSALMLDHLRAVMRETKYRLDRVTLRAMGIATLLRSMGREESQTLLAVELAGGLAEFCVVEGGAIRFARSAEISGADPESTAGALVTETRRTWMSFRFAETGGDIGAVALIGDPAVMRIAAERIEPMIQVESEVLLKHPLVQPGSLDQSDIYDVWPLAGLLLEPVLGRETIDFLHPRRHILPAERLRRPVLLAVAFMVLALLGLWTYARRDLAQLRADVATYQSQRAELRPAEARLGRETVRVQHVNLWNEARVDWMEHLRALGDLLPPPNEVVLDRWTGSIGFRGVQFDRRSRAWSAPRRILIAVDGEAASRALADDLRASLVSSPWYETSSTGSDGAGGRRLPYRFSYRLASGERAPVDDAGDGEETENGTEERPDVAAGEVAE